MHPLRNLKKRIFIKLMTSKAILSQPMLGNLANISIPKFMDVVQYSIPFFNNKNCYSTTCNIKKGFHPDSFFPFFIDTKQATFSHAISPCLHRYIFFSTTTAKTNELRLLFVYCFDFSKHLQMFVFDFY